MPSDDLRDRFLAGMSHAAQTVNVVTTDGAAGRAGVTVSAMTSVSADTQQPTLLVCVHRDTSAAPAILRNGVFCVNVLRDDQSWISDAFAGRFRAQVPDKFQVAGWEPMRSGAPRVLDPLVAFDCRLVSADLVGTHHVFFGEVGEIFIAEGGSPLIYARRAYGAAAPIEAAGAGAGGDVAAGGRLALGCHSVAAGILPALLRRLHEAAPEVEVAVVEGDQARLHAALASGEAELALMVDDGLAERLVRAPVAALVPHVLLAADSPLAGHDTLSPADLHGQPMVLLSAPPAGDHLLSLLRGQGAEPRIAWRATSPGTVRHLVGQGLGFALLAGPVCGTAQDAVIQRPLAWDAPRINLAVVRRQQASPSRAAGHFEDICRKAAAEQG